MLVTQTLRLSRLLTITWKTDLLMLIACAAAFLIDRYLFGERLQVPSTLPALLGTAIAFFIGFNNNQAYSRWWEARIIWGGLVNDSRSWARQILHFLPDQSPGLTDRKQQMVYRHLAFVYALRSALRRSDDKTFAQFLSDEEANQVAQAVNVPNAILDRQAHALQSLVDEGHLDVFRFREFNQLLINFCDHMGRSERINNTVFPATYIYFTRVCIWLFIILTTLAVAETAHGWSILFGSLLGFVYHVTHINGLSLVNPFVAIPTGVPLDSISRTIEINLRQALGESQLPPPVQAVNGEYVL